MESVHEEWRPVQGYEGAYEVSSQGRVRSVDRIVKGRWGDYIKTGKILSYSRRHGYLGVSLFKNAIARTWSVHRLVATAFIGHPPDGYEVNHKNGIKSDNKRENLEWVTASENGQHAVDMGLRVAVKGQCHGGAKLRDKDVINIRRRYAYTPVTQAELAAEYGIDVAAVSLVVRGKNWRHLKVIPTNGTIKKCKITPAMLAEVRSRYSNGCVSQKTLALELGVGQSTVSRALRGVLPRHLIAS